jgi:hypothetical protein
MRSVSEYIVNPRRAPRAPSRCVTQVRTGAAAFAAETEDIGPTGCQLVAPGALPRGMPMTLTFANPKVKGALSVEGMVAWGSSRPPWRIGVAFGERSRSSAQLWFEALVAAYPGLGGYRRVPDRLPVDAMIFLAPPPSFLFDFSPDEVEVLRHVAGGTTIATLRGRLGDRWSGCQRALFGLMARSVVTVNRSAASHPAAWKQVMKELEAEFVPDVPRLNRTVTRELPVVHGTATPVEQSGALRFDLPPAMSQPAPPPPLPRPAPPPVARPTPLSVEAVGGEATAGNGWRGGTRARTREAQEYFDLGRSELAAGRGNSAMAHLRRALQLAPGDADIAAELGRAMTGAPPR